LAAETFERKEKRGQVRQRELGDLGFFVFVFVFVFVLK